MIVTWLDMLTPIIVTVILIVGYVVLVTVIITISTVLAITIEFIQDILKRRA